MLTRKMSPSKDQNLRNLRLSLGPLFENKFKSFVRTAPDWNHLSDDQVSESPHTSRLQTTDRHPKHHLTPVRTPLLSHLNRTLGPTTYEIKTSNCNITKPSTVASQASFPNKRSLPAQLVFFLRKMASFIILRSMSLFGVAQQLKTTYILFLYCF